jgi:hypothetical protein
VTLAALSGPNVKLAAHSAPAGGIAHRRKFGRNSPATRRRACIDPAHDGNTVLFARINLT